MPTESFIGVIKQRVGKYDANGKSSAYDLETILNVVNGDGTKKVLKNGVFKTVQHKHYDDVKNLMAPDPTLVTFNRFITKLGLKTKRRDRLKKIVYGPGRPGRLSALSVFL